MKKTINLTAPLTLTAAAGKPRRFAILAYSGGVLHVDGFANGVVVDLSTLQVPTSVPILIDHTKSVEATIGITDSIVNDGATLTMGGVVTGTSPMASQVLAQAAAGHQWQASIGAMVSESEEIAAGQSVVVNGQSFVGPVIVARHAVLRETSVLPMGADATTQVNLAARAASFLKGAAMPTFEDWLKSLGVDVATLTPENQAALQLAFESTQAPAAPVAAAPPVASPVAAPLVAPTAAAGVAPMDIQAAYQAQLQAGRKLLAEQMRHQAEIQAAAVGFPLIAAKAVEENWNLDKVKLEVLLASQRKTRPTSHGAAQSPPELLPQVLEAALCVTRKIKNVEKQFSDQVLQAAHTQFRRGIGLQQMFLMAAAQSGMPVGAGDRIHSGNLREVLAYAFPQQLQAAFSTVTLPGILSNVANKELLEGYMEEDPAWREVARIKSVSDFKTVTSYRMLDDMEYEQLGPGGEIKHGKLAEESYTRQANTFAKMFSLTRTDIINDDLGAFDDLKNRIGRGAAKKLTKVFWTEFLSDASTFWTSTRTNYITGSTTNLGTDGVGLGLGVTAFRKMTSPATDGSKRVNGAGGRAEILLVPPELEFIAETLHKNGNLGAVANSSANVFANKYRPVIAWQLSDSSYTGYSTTAWYLLNSPSYSAVVDVSFLNGQETPTVESADADFNTLGVQFRGYHDFGCDQAEYLAGVKSKGAT